MTLQKQTGEREKEENYKKAVEEVEEHIGLISTCLRPRRISDHRGWLQQVLIRLV